MATVKRLLVLLSLLPWIANSANVLEIMKGKSVEEFSKLLVNSPVASQYLQNELTIFAPSDKAMRKYVGVKDDQFIINHMVNVVVQVADRASYSDVTRVSSLLPGSPPLWMTRRGTEYFIGGAKIIMRNLQATSDRGARKQRLQILDDVLEPLTPLVADNSQAYIDLTAGKLLRESEMYRITGHSIKQFASQVRSKKKFSLFDQPGQHTFFVPVDSAFQDLSKELVDENVIPGHIVPNSLLFTKPRNAREQKTATYQDKSSIKVTAVIQTSPDGYQVKSNTVQGNRHHTREHVIANIVKANIPVANGIVHLIDRPLIVIAAPLWKYLNQEKVKGGRLSKFARYVQTFGNGLQGVIANAASGTVFAPTNEAFDKIPQSELETMLGSSKGERILGMHFVNQRIPAEDVRILQPQNEMRMFGAKLTFPPGSNDHLWFYYTNNNETFMLDGQGVTAEVVEPDIGATNGVIHVIDHLLGFPQHTIAEKLSHDPMMSSVYTLGNQNHFNKMFNNSDEKFTYLVPSDQAWRDVHRSFASIHKILFMGSFAYQTQTLLERHLRIGDALTIEQLVEKTTMDGGVNMLRGLPGFKFVTVADEEHGNYTVVEWEDLVAKVIRSNLECTNGYIHIIDKVIMKRRDLVLSSGHAHFATPILTTALLSFSLMFYYYY